MAPRSEAAALGDGPASKKRPLSDPCAIMSGGPRSRWVYFEDQIPAGYVATERRILVGEQWPRADEKFQAIMARVYVWAALVDKTVRSA